MSSAGTPSSLRALPHRVGLLVAVVHGIAVLIFWWFLKGMNGPEVINAWVVFALIDFPAAYLGNALLQLFPGTVEEFLVGNDHTGLALFFAVVGGVQYYLLAFLLTAAIVWRVRSGRNHLVCRSCGYDMRGSPRRCPECGSQRTRSP